MYNFLSAYNLGLTEDDPLFQQLVAEQNAGAAQAAGYQPTSMDWYTSTFDPYNFEAQTVNGQYVPLPSLYGTTAAGNQGSGGWGELYSSQVRGTPEQALRTLTSLPNWRELYNNAYMTALPGQEGSGGMENAAVAKVLRDAGYGSLADQVAGIGAQEQGAISEYRDLQANTPKTFNMMGEGFGDYLKTGIMAALAAAGGYALTTPAAAAAGAAEGGVAAGASTVGSDGLPMFLEAPTAMSGTPAALPAGTVVPQLPAQVLMPTAGGGFAMVDPSTYSVNAAQGFNTTRPEGSLSRGPSQGFNLSAEAANASPIGQTASQFGAAPVTEGQAAAISYGGSQAAGLSGSVPALKASMVDVEGAFPKGGGPSVQGTEKSYMDRLRDKALEKGASKALDYFMRPAYDYTGTGAARVDNGTTMGVNPFKAGNLENLFGGDIDAITEEAMRQLGFASGRQGLQQSSVEAEGKDAIGQAQQGYKTAVDDANKTAEQLFNEQQQQTKAYGDSLAAQGYGEDQISAALGELPTSADAYVAEPDLPDFSMIDLVARGGTSLPSRKKRKASGASAATPGEETDDYGGQILRT